MGGGWRGENASSSDTTQSNLSWPRNGYVEELNAKNIEAILWGKKKLTRQELLILLCSLCVVPYDGKLKSRAEG